MNDSIFQINADNIDTQKLVDDVKKSVADKMEQGCYADAVVARAERTNLTNLQSDEEFMDFYLDCLRDSVFIDINDFEIIERRSKASAIYLLIKKTLWKLLKFYTYRLWSQQNQVNGLLLSAIESSEIRSREKIADLEKRIAELEKQGDGK